MQVRRVVTHLNEDGHSAVWMDGPPPTVQNVESVPGLSTYFLWASEETPTVPHQAGDPTVGLTQYFPEAGGLRFLIVTHPPGSGVTTGTSVSDLEREVGIDAAPRDSEGIMHRTDTLDLGVVISGEMTMAMEDGTEVTLRSGETVVQTGVRHGWMNRSTSPAVMAFVLVGAHPHLG